MIPNRLGECQISMLVDLFTGYLVYYHTANKTTRQPVHQTTYLAPFPEIIAQGVFATIFKS